MLFHEIITICVHAKKELSLFNNVWKNYSWRTTEGQRFTNAQHTFTILSTVDRMPLLSDNKAIGRIRHFVHPKTQQLLTIFAAVIYNLTTSAAAHNALKDGDFRFVTRSDVTCKASIQYL